MLETFNAAQNPNKLEIASLYLMVAIGAQCSGCSNEDAASAAALFSYARRLCLERMLENPSLELVKVFILMAFYMFGACRRNSAFMYLGVASKAADILGLHMSPQHKHLPPEIRNARYVGRRRYIRRNIQAYSRTLLLQNTHCKKPPGFRYCL
jgi:hypothetical protein